MSERVWRAQPRQREFLRRTEDEVLYGGSAGGGKTDALLIDHIRTCVRYPGAQTLFLRKTFADLNKPGAAIPRSHDLLTGVAHWHGDTHRWTFPNRSVLQFGHVQHEKDVYSYQGSQIDRLAFDELTQFTAFEYAYLKSRVRATVPGMRTGVRAATNPGGIGHGWVKERFIAGHIPGEPWTLTEAVAGHERTISLAFIPAKVWDNPALLERDPEYPVRLAALGEDLARALLEGDWDAFTGQYFGEWRYDRHTCDPFPIPPVWTRWVAVDWGYADPWCALWFAREPGAGRIYVYREVYGPGLREEQQAARLRELSAHERIARWVADPSMFNARTESKRPSIASIYQSKPYLIALQPAGNARVPGWQAVRRALAGDPPRLQVFRTCLNLIRTLPEQVHDAIDPEDLADRANGVKTEDHAVDTLRYGLYAESTPTRTIDTADVALGYGRSGATPKAHRTIQQVIADKRKQRSTRVRG